MNKHLRTATLLAALVSSAAVMPAGRAAAQSRPIGNNAPVSEGDLNLPVTSAGYEQLANGRTFYLEVPMIDTRVDGGIGMNITAESIINNVRFAGDNPDINHVVFKMDTGGGKIFHADAMADVIEEYHDRLEFHIVIEDAISAGIWTVFSCDNVFICDQGTIGGAVMYITMQDGSVRESPDIPIKAAQLGKMAERNGHPGALLPAMMHLPAELHYWSENGEVIVSNAPPRSPGSVEGHKVLDKKDSVLTLTAEQAIAIGFAKHIDDFNTELVGEMIGAPQWTRANQYGRVIDEIGAVYNKTMPMQDMYFEEKLELPFIRKTRDNRNHPQVIAITERRSGLEKMVSALKQINDALNNLPYCHPERNIYFAGEDGKTILADIDQWQEDVRQSKAYASQLAAGLRDLRMALRILEIDAKNIDNIESAISDIVERIKGIAAQGNAAYWAEQD